MDWSNLFQQQPGVPTSDDQEGGKHTHKHKNNFGAPEGNVDAHGDEADGSQRWKGNLTQDGV